MAKTYDVVVVGAGPAGSMTAKAAGESGLKVALLERKTDNSKIRRSDGGAIGVNHYMFGEVVKFNHKTRTFVFPVSGFSVKYDGPWNNGLYGFQLYSPGGKRFIFGDLGELRKDPEKNTQGIAISKGKLIDGIVNEAKATGVEYFPNTNVTHIKTLEDGAAVTVNGEDYQARFVVAADGVNSRIVRQLGLNRDRKFAGTSRDQTWMVEGAQIPDPEGLKFIITMYGIFSVSPQAGEGQFHLGTFSYDPNEDLGALIKRFTQEDPVYSPWFKNAKRMEAEEACVVNLWQPIEKPYKDHVVMVGDSCWIQEFSTAASLCAGHRLGHALTRAFHDEKFNEEGVAPYLDWYTRYCFEPRGGEELGGTGRLFDYLTAEELDYLAALPKKPAPHTLSFYKLFETIFRTYGKLVPQITKEQPGIMEKLKKMGKDRSEAQSRRIKAGFPNK